MRDNNGNCVEFSGGDSDDDDNDDDQSNDVCDYEATNFWINGDYCFNDQPSCHRSLQAMPPTFHIGLDPQIEDYDCTPTDYSCEYTLESSSNGATLESTSGCDFMSASYTQSDSPAVENSTIKISVNSASGDRDYFRLHLTSANSNDELAFLCDCD